MKKFSAFFIACICLGLGILSTKNVKAQTPVVIYDQNFDSSALLPTGWVTSFNDTIIPDTSTGGWIIDTTLSDSSFGYPGASGLNNVAVKNSFANGTYQLISSSISTMEDTNISVRWGVRNSNKFFLDGGSISFWYSPDNGATWDSIAYLEAAANSDVWSVDTPPVLPVAANRNAGIKFKWIATVTSSGASGSYRIDDFIVSGISTGVATAVTSVANPEAHVYMSNSTLEVIANETTNNQYTIEVYNILGETMKTGFMTSSPYSMDLSELPGGVYLVKVSDGDNNQVTKVVRSK